MNSLEIRRKFIADNKECIRKDIPENEWNFDLSIFFDNRIMVWHIKADEGKGKYRNLFNHEMIKAKEEESKINQ